MTAKTRRTTMCVTAALLTIAVAKPAMAYWVGGFSLLATAGAFGVTDGLAIAAGFAQAGGLTFTCGVGDPGFQPSFVTSLTSGPAPTCSATMLSTTYPTYSLPGNSLDPLYTAVNTAIGALNSLDADVKSRASRSTLVSAGRALANDTLAIAAQASLLLPAANFTASQLNAAAVQIGTSGLPPGETSFLTSGGWTSADLSSLQAYDASLVVNFNVPSISVQTIIRTLGQEELASIPEPATIALLGVGLLSLFGVAPRRRRN
jgi:hypothetical protein